MVNYRTPVWVSKSTVQKESKIAWPPRFPLIA